MRAADCKILVEKAKGLFHHAEKPAERQVSLLYAKFSHVVQQGHGIHQEIPHPVAQLRAEGGFGKILMDGAGDLILPFEEPLQPGIVAGLHTFVLPCRDGSTGGALHTVDELQKRLRIPGDLPAEFL